jgi:putative thioredoxin
MSPVDFETRVVERSRTVPVVVDLWAEWCAPCRTLGPVLERLAADAGGRWELVKVDVDEQPELAQAFGVQGIPAVKMFRDGRIVAEFLGALPAPQIERWLAEHVPSAGTRRLEALVARWPEEGPALADELEAYAREHPDEPEAQLRLAQAIVGRDPARAVELLRASGDGAGVDVDVTTDIGALAELMELAIEPAPRLAPHLEAARAALRDHDIARALDALIDAAMIDKSFADELPRRAAVALLRLLGQEHPLTREHQRRLAMALHV